MDGLYHYLLGFPKVEMPKGILPLVYGEHAKDEIRSDRYGKINAPQSINFLHAKIVELEVKNGCVEKVVARIHHDARRDLILVVKPDGFVKTVWLNTKDDKHKTLNRARYRRP